MGHLNFDENKNQKLSRLHNNTNNYKYSNTDSSIEADDESTNFAIDDDTFEEIKFAEIEDDSLDFDSWLDEMEKFTKTLKRRGYNSDEAVKLCMSAHIGTGGLKPLPRTIVTRQKKKEPLGCSFTSKAA